MNIKKFLMPYGGSMLRDSLSGTTVALALVPEAIAFALVAGVSPFVGLYAAFFMCLITAIFGGRPGMISGATGSMAVVMVSLVHQFGTEALFACVVLTGLIQIGIGVLGLGKLIRMMPKSVMVGFVNGLAIVIFIAQFSQFKIPLENGVSVWLQGVDLYAMIGLVILAMVITHYLPKFSKKIPGALAAIIVVSLIASLLANKGIHIQVVNDMMKGATNQGFPSFSIPQKRLNFELLRVIGPYSIILAMIGLSESLMTLSLIDERTSTKGRGNKECIAQGGANIISGFFHSMGGCAMIGQSMINITSGGRGRLSGIVAGLALILFILFAWPLIKIIPLAALVGVMFMVVLETFEWATFKFIRKIPAHDALVIMVVTCVTVIFDLAIAVLVGIVMASLVFAWRTAKTIRADISECDEGDKTYSLRGLLFFASVTPFKALFDCSLDSGKIIIDFKQARVCDHSAIDAIKDIVWLYGEKGITVKLANLSGECRQILEKMVALIDEDSKTGPSNIVTIPLSISRA
jgi:sulfate permease, SulP family